MKLVLNGQNYDFIYQINAEPNQLSLYDHQLHKRQMLSVFQLDPGKLIDICYPSPHFLTPSPVYVLFEILHVLLFSHFTAQKVEL